MKRRTPSKTTAYVLYNQEKEMLGKLQTKSTFFLTLLDMTHPDWIKIPIQNSEPSKPAAYHCKVYNWLCNLTQEQRREVFVISDQSQVRRLLSKLTEVHDEARQNSERRTKKMFLRDWICSSKRKMLENFKIAWMSEPVIYIDPTWALKWLQETLGTQNFFFPFEHSCKQLEIDPRLRGNAKWLQSKVLQLQQLLAIYLRKSIVIRSENSKVPSELARINKVMDYTDKTTNSSRRITELVFRMSLWETFYLDYQQQIEKGKQLEDNYFAHLEEQAMKLLEKVDSPKPAKLSKRAKRNLKTKQAQQAKKKLVEMLHFSEISAISVNPEDNQMSDSIVDLDAYKIKEHEESAIIPASNSSETKSAPQMHKDQFMPPQEQNNKEKKSANTSTNSGQYQEKKQCHNSSNQHKRKQNRYGRRRYEEKKIVCQQKSERSTHEIYLDAEKAALNLFGNFLENKLKKLEMENEQAWELKKNCYNRLLNYFGAKIPYCSVNLFGSLASGVAIPSSDIDILLTPLPNVFVSQSFLSQLAFDLSTLGWTTYCSPILTAKIPVIKLIIDPFISFESPISQFRFCSHEQQMNLPFLVKFDITLNATGHNTTGLFSTSYMQNMFSFQPKLKQSMIVLKHLLEQAELNESFKGGVSSYNLFAMLICYSKHKKFNFDLPLSEFLLGFFHFFAYEFDATSSVLRSETEEPCVISFEEYNQIADSEDLGNSAFKMIDPINGKLVRASFSRYEELQNLFRQLADAFQEVEEKARQVALSLVGRGKRNSWEIVSTVQAETAKTETAGRLASLLLIK